MAELLEKNPRADREFGLIRKGWESDLAVVAAQRDSSRVDMWRCEATKPAPRSMFDSFEAGAIIGVASVVLIIFVLDAQLE